jgi:hypothetical protein
MMSLRNGIFGASASVAINAALIAAFASILGPSIAQMMASHGNAVPHRVDVESQFFNSPCAFSLERTPAVVVSRIAYRKPRLDPQGPSYFTCIAINAAGKLSPVWVGAGDLDKLGKWNPALVPFEIQQLSPFDDNFWWYM